MEKRKAHTKPKFTNMDLSKPLDINVIGSTEDPCFGKHHSLTASQCRICGDNEVCSVITAQLVNTRLRAKEERTHRFKDLEEAELLAAQEKAIRVSIKKLSDNDSCPIAKVAKRVAKKIGYTVVTRK